MIQSGEAHGLEEFDEQVQALTARLKQEEETARTQKREVRRLQDDVTTLKEALKMRGEAGSLQEELMHVRAERMQLAIFGSGP